MDGSPKETKRKGSRKSITFDIIAGTSIGAMNAAVLTSYVVENDTYEGSAERLDRILEIFVQAVNGRYQSLV